MITSSTDPKAPPEPTLDEMLDGIEEALSVPRPIGMLFDKVVYLNSWDRTLTFETLTVSVDHPYLAGTAIRAAALEAMGETKPKREGSL